MGRPAHVQVAIFNGDSSALSAMGRAGGKAAAKKRAKRALEQEALETRRLSEMAKMVAERNGDPDD